MTACQVCGECEAKYKCPACSLQTCSLPCVSKHKKEQRCSGKRPRSDYVKITEFKDDTLHRDFSFLEESGTLLYRCRSNARPDLLRKRDQLKSECYRRGIHLKLMPHVFSLAQGNSTSLRNRKHAEGVATIEILWKVDWKFESVDKVLTDICVSENLTLEELLTRFVENTWKLGSTDGLFRRKSPSNEQLEVFLINYQKEEVKVDTKLSLRDSMRDQAILEYPTFIIRERVDEVSNF